jgi:hypothetical protein
VPAEQAFGRQQRAATGRGIQHHLDHPFDMAVHRRERADIHAQPAGDGRAHGFDAEDFAFDLAGLDDIVGQRRQAGPVAPRHADLGETPQEHALGTADLDQRGDQRR